MSIVVPFVWTPIASWADAALLFSLGIIGGLGHYFVARAMVYAQASIIAPFGYWQLMGSVVVGYIISGYLPDAFTWIGAAIIVCAGCYIAWSETRVRRRARSALSAQRGAYLRASSRAAVVALLMAAPGRPAAVRLSEGPAETSMISFFRHGLGEGLVGVDRDHERVGAADHVGPVVLIEEGLQRQDRQAVDADAGAHRLVARVRRGPAAIVGAVARNVDHPPRALERAPWRTASWRGRWRR